MEEEIRMGIKNKENKSILMGKLRRKKIVMHYIEVCQKKIDNLIHKEYALEQINITKMQLDAIKSTVSVFKNFNKTNDVEKIEKLYDQLQDFTDDMKDFNDLIENQPLMEFDEDELVQELDELGEFKEIPIVATTTVPLPDVPNICLKLGCIKQSQSQFLVLIHSLNFVPPSMVYLYPFIKIFVLIPYLFNFSSILVQSFYTL